MKQNTSRSRSALCKIAGPIEIYSNARLREFEKANRVSLKLMARVDDALTRKEKRGFPPSRERRK
jgi:hypothetical protein